MKPTPQRPQRKFCIFCEENVAEPDVRDAENLRRFVSSHAKILPRKKTGTCALHQRRLAVAIKQARELGYLPYQGQKK